MLCQVRADEEKEQVRRSNHDAHNLRFHSKKKMSEDRRGHPGYMKGKHHSEESRKKISQSLKGRPETEEHRRKISEAKKGKHHTEESIRKMSESKKGKPGHPCSEETKEKMRNFWRKWREQKRLSDFSDSTGKE